METFTLEMQDMDQRKAVKPPYVPKHMREKEVEVFYTPFEKPAAVEEETEFRHTHWSARRARVREILAAAGTTSNNMFAFDHCGADCHVYKSEETGEFKLSGSYCKNRHCQPCARAKANLMAANLREKLAEAKPNQYRFITLTLKHSDTPLIEQIKRLNESYKKLRKYKSWKESQEGGAAILEVKWNPETRQWHPHLHIISEGGYLNKRQLSYDWLACTGDSSIVDIRALDSANDAAHYVAKYVSKGTNDAVWADPEAAIEWVISTRGVRTAATFGTWRGFALLATSEDKQTWKYVGSLEEIVRKANEGIADYIKLIDVLRAEKQYNPHAKRPKKIPPIARKA